MVQQGRLHAWRVRWFGERDLAAEQLADVARQGTGMARLAHAAAAALLVLFSLAAVIALGGDVLEQVLASLRAGGLPNIPALISLLVAFLLVPCMDVAMLYAASQLRLMATRRATTGYALHRTVLLSVALLESATYLYMVWQYEAPHGIAWALVILRAVAAPLLSVYLSMARPLPVTARDIMARVEYASGLGMIRDTVTIANNPEASLAQKAALFNASAQMSPEDRAGLGVLLAQVGGDVPSGVRVIEASAETGDIPRLPAPTPIAQARVRHGGTSRPRRAKRVSADFTSKEGQARTAWRPGMSVEALMKAADIGKGTAQKYAAKFTAEYERILPEAEARMAQAS